MNIDKDKLESIRTKHNLSLILLHGSQVTGQTHTNSDIDIAVVRKDRERKYKLLELIRDLSSAFNTDKIDISDLTHADPLLLYSATRQSKLLSGSTKDYDSLIKLAFHKYNDYKPFLERERLFVLERLNNYVSD